MNYCYMTINSANYIPRGMALLDSIRAQDPGASLHMVLAEDDATYAQVAGIDGVRLWSASSLGIPELRDMSFYYNITEFNTALKPFAILKLMEAGFDAVTYFDPDIQVFSELAQLETLLARHELLLTPHIAKPAKEDGNFPSVRQCIHAGQFNLGFISLRRSEQVMDFLQWWADHLREECIMEPDYSFFVDQLWASAAPSFVDDTKIIRSDAWNMAYWNIQQRSLWLEGQRWMTGTGPLFFFHYSGYDLMQPRRLSRFTERYAEVAPGSKLDVLLAGYREAVARMRDLHTYGHIPYSFGSYRDGGSISAPARRRYLRMSPENRARLGDPFSAAGALE